MEEDIKILEKLSSIYQELKKDFEEGHASSYEMQFEDFTAIENLLKRYKELEEELESEKFYHNADKEFIQKYHDEASELNTKCINLETQLSNSIPISVIQNTLKEINKKEKEELKGLKGQDRYFVKQMYQYMRKPLQKLLEERE